MTLAHSVSCKSAEQSPQERKSCQASILTMKGCGHWKEANQTQQWPGLLWPQWACESSHGSSLQTGKNEALSTVGRLATLSILLTQERCKAGSAF